MMSLIIFKIQKFLQTDRLNFSVNIFEKFAITTSQDNKLILNTVMYFRITNQYSLLVTMTFQQQLKQIDHQFNQHY